MSKCSECGTVYDGWSCPACAARKEHEDRIANAHEEHESNIRDAFEADNESRREAANALLEAQAELFVQEERAREQHRAELEEVARRDNQARQKIASEAWRLQAEDKAKRARELYRAGMYQEAVDLCLEAADPKRGGDPGNFGLYVTAYDSFQRLGKEGNANVMLQKQITLVKALNEPDSRLIDVLQRVIKKKNNAALLKELMAYIGNLAYFPKEVLRGLISASEKNVEFLRELMAHAGQHLTYFPKEILNELIIASQRDVARIVYLNSYLKANEVDVLVYGIELSIKPEGVLKKFRPEFVAAKFSQMADLLDAYLAKVEFTDRHEIFSKLKEIAKEKGVFSESTNNRVSLAIQKRYKEWEPSINKNIEKEASDYAATASVSSDKPKRASRVVGAISFVSLMMFTPLNFILSLILSGIGAYIVFISTRRQILNDIKKHHFAALHYKENMAASPVGIDIKPASELGNSDAMVYGILTAAMVVLAGSLVGGKLYPEPSTSEKTTAPNTHNVKKTPPAREKQAFQKKQDDLPKKGTNQTSIEQSQSIKKPPEKSAHQKGRSAASYVQPIEKVSGSVRFKHVNDKYPLYDEYKAIAVNIVPNKSWGDGLVVGYAYEYSSQEEANERAIYECNRESIGKYRVSGCELYAIGDKVVQ